LPKQVFGTSRTVDLGRILKVHTCCQRSLGGRADVFIGVTMPVLSEETITPRPGSQSHFGIFEEACCFGGLFGHILLLQ
jgi:hypothetical protein